VLGPVARRERARRGDDPPLRQAQADGLRGRAPHAPPAGRGVPPPGRPARRPGVDPPRPRARQRAPVRVRGDAARARAARRRVGGARPVGGRPAGPLRAGLAAGDRRGGGRRRRRRPRLARRRAPARRGDRDARLRRVAVYSGQSIARIVSSSSRGLSTAMVSPTATPTRAWPSGVAMLTPSGTTPTSSVDTRTTARSWP